MQLTPNVERVLALLISSLDAPSEHSSLAVADQDANEPSREHCVPFLTL